MALSLTRSHTSNVAMAVQLESSSGHFDINLFNAISSIIVFCIHFISLNRFSIINTRPLPKFNLIAVNSKYHIARQRSDVLYRNWFMISWNCDFGFKIFNLLHRLIKPLAVTKQRFKLLMRLNIYKAAIYRCITRQAGYFDRNVAVQLVCVHARCATCTDAHIRITPRRIHVA